MLYGGPLPIGCPLSLPWKNSRLHHKFLSNNLFRYDPHPSRQMYNLYNYCKIHSLEISTNKRWPPQLPTISMIQHPPPSSPPNHHPSPSSPMYGSLTLPSPSAPFEIIPAFSSISSSISPPRWPTAVSNSKLSLFSSTAAINGGDTRGKSWVAYSRRVIHISYETKSGVIMLCGYGSDVEI